MPIWYFETGNPPFLENIDPASASTSVDVDTNISFYVVDAESGVDPSSIDAYVDGADAYKGTVGFIAPYNGPSSSFTYLPGGSADGYDAYAIVLDNTGLLPTDSIITTRVVAADNYGNVLDTDWTFTTWEGDPPFLENLDPFSGETGVALDKTISFYITDAFSGVRASTIDAYVEVCG